MSIVYYKYGMDRESEEILFDLMRIACAHCDLIVDDIWHGGRPQDIADARKMIILLVYEFMDVADRMIVDTVRMSRSNIVNMRQQGLVLLENEEFAKSYNELKETFLYP